MKQIFIVLMIAAIGAGVYFYLRRHQSSSFKNSRELIVGKWKVDSMTVDAPVGTTSSSHQDLFQHLIDSSLKGYEFEFTKDGLILQILNGKVADTTHFQFTDNNNLTVWANANTLKAAWHISQLDPKSMIVKDQDSGKFYFQRVR